MGILYAAIFEGVLANLPLSIRLLTVIYYTRIIAYRTLTFVVPFPGGSTAVGALGFSGALTAFGVPQNVAVSTALANQLVTSFVPAIPGVFATRHLIATEQI